MSVLNTFSKVYETVIKDQTVFRMEKYFSPFLSVYRKNCSLQNILINLIEEWRKDLANNFVVGPVLTDLSKAFNCIPHDLLISVLSAYNFTDEALSHIYSYRTNCRQCVCINNTHSQLEILISSVLQGPILGPILFNLSINDLVFFEALASLYNFADDNTKERITVDNQQIKVLSSVKLLGLQLDD